MKAQSTWQNYYVNGAHGGIGMEWFVEIMDMSVRNLSVVFYQLNKVCIFCVMPCLFF